MFGGSLHKKLGHSERWTLHDLRRTFATCVAGLGIGPHVVEALLGHSLGGVAGIYNRQSYLAEQLTALELWAEKVAELRGSAGNPLFVNNGLYPKTMIFQLDRVA